MTTATAPTPTPTPADVKALVDAALTALRALDEAWVTALEAEKQGAFNDDYTDDLGDFGEVVGGFERWSHNLANRIDAAKKS